MSIYIIFVIKKRPNKCNNLEGVHVRREKITSSPSFFKNLYLCAGAFFYFSDFIHYVNKNLTVEIGSNFDKSQWC